MPHNQDQPRQIFLGNISYDAHPDDVVTALREAGVQVARVRLATFKETGAPRGFGFLDLEPSLRPVEDVIAAINDAEISLLGRVMRADTAKPRKPAPGSERARSEATWQEKGKKRGGGSKGKRPGGGRGQSRNEFQRGRNEFEGD